MGRLPTGVRKVGKRYEKRFTLNKQRYSVYGYCIDDLVEAEAKKRKELASGIIQNNSTLDDYFKTWIDSRKYTVKEITILTNETRYKNISNCVYDRSKRKFGELKIKEITPQHIKALQKKLMSEKGANVTNKAIALLRQLLGTAHKERYIDWNPCDCITFIKDTGKKATDTKHRALTREETRKFLESAEMSYYQYLYKFALLCGCRIGELASLKHSDIDLINNVIHIQRTVTRTKDGKYIIGDSPKTFASIRDIPITPEMKSVLKEQRELQNAFHIQNINNLIFETLRGTLIIPCTVNNDMKAICKRAGIEQITFHALRDTFATRAIESGINPKTLQMILGHADISMTMNLYCHVMEDTKQEEMKLLEIV